MKTQSPSGAQVARGASYLFIQGVSVNISAFLFLTLAARLLSISNIGAVSALGMTTTLLATIGTFAVPSAATKYISEYMGKGGQNTAKEIYKKILRFGLLASISISLVCLALSTTISQILLNDASLQPVIIVLAFDIGALIFNLLLNGILFGLQKFRLIALVGILIGLLRLFGPLSFVLANFGLLGVVYGWVVGDFAGTFMLLFIVSASFRHVKSLDDNFGKASFAELLKYSLPLYGASIVAYFSATIDKFIVLSFSNLAALGIYSIAIAAVSVVGIVSGSISNSLFPQLAQMHGQYGTNALKEASTKASRYIFLIFVPLSVGLVATAYPALQLFFGDSYTPGWSAVVIVSSVVAVTSASVIIGNILLSLGMTRTVLESSVVGVVTGALVSVVLVSPLGSTGAAIGRAALLSASFGYSAYRLRNNFGLHLDYGAFKKSLFCSGIMAVGVIAMQLVMNGKYMLPVYIATGGIIYALMLRFSKAVNNEDIQLLKAVFPNRFHGIVTLFAKFFSHGQDRQLETPKRL